jgi:hypothetical protein
MSKQKKRLTARRKFDIYLATRGKDAPVGELLREYGLHLNDLREIERAVEEGAVEALKSRNISKKKQPVPAAQHRALVLELQRKEKALSEITVEYTLLKKKDTLGYMDPSNDFTLKEKNEKGF